MDEDDEEEVQAADCLGAGSDEEADDAALEAELQWNAHPVAPDEDDVMGEVSGDEVADECTVGDDVKEDCDWERPVGGDIEECDAWQLALETCPDDLECIMLQDLHGSMDSLVISVLGSELRAARRTVGGQWEAVNITPANAKDNIPLVTGCRIQRHSRDGTISWQGWYPTSSPGAPQSHHRTGENAFQEVVDWLWMRHGEHTHS
jgi:hypothetical protein